MTLMITVKIVPSSGKISWTYDKQGRLKLYIKSPAQQGRANSEVIRCIAQALKIQTTDIQIVSGATAPLKMIKINTSMTLPQFLQRIGLDIQQSLL